ncbi:hypothetical protein ASF00_06070 [Sphingomonas sp. Leaf34]|uniref:hypothetical protein n=1 Tax=Sphingomonas sp. Leaf34 TaxID=1736216 RepID=UPI0006FEC886|nr:hypothetical protein [Sphingomonas sp. Leaf34]KQN30331.1 hypothetical protein ASF00_06070 [Sphingomonas sp. Leaf34]
MTAASHRCGSRLFTAPCKARRADRLHRRCAHIAGDPLAARYATIWKQIAGDPRAHRHGSSPTGVA